MHVSPFFISEDKLSQFEVTQHDASLVAVCHSQSHLTEESAGVLLIQSATALHQGVHVPKVFVQEHIGLTLTEDDVPDAGHILVGWQDPVGSDLFLVHPHIKDLGRERRVEEEERETGWKLGREIGRERECERGRMQWVSVFLMIIRGNNHANLAES